MAADMHPPMLTDTISNPLYHAYQGFWDSYRIGHSDLNNVMNTWLVMIILIVAALFVRRKLEMVPRGQQNFWEVAIVVLEDLVVQTMGEKGRPYFPLIATLGLFILLSNLLGILPWLLSSTSNWNTTLALALCSFTMTHYIGIRYHGIKYVKHFCGPVWWLIPLMLPIEVISHLSRVLSLSIRLFGNIFGEDVAVIILTMLVPFLVPLPMMVLQVFTSFIQTLVFMMLTMMYLQGALEEAH